MEPGVQDVAKNDVLSRDCLVACLKPAVHCYM